ncbi:DUF928 domain-containing protein [Anabaena sphaerica FACHB-251]|uniref:DUF928 domain-containing protein n=1 Tax=Anabaena sphaerica FACHB-251 TaxID=2692883 RepID=A0A926WEP2_9NOST|nr:DUF928 domain-containing protein [Anabaena sphaerica]MBD2292772.1 DUF928 domain-containing protein [Anabaena sphaerica FACHB-251]
MPIKISSFAVKTRHLSIVTGILMIPILPIPSNAQLYKGLQVSVKFPPVQDLGAPARTSGAGSRGPACGHQNSDAEGTAKSSDEIKIPLTALTPENNVLTTAALDPKVYVYVPQAVNKQAEFRLIDTQDEKIVYKTTFPLVNTPGIVKIGIPKTANIKANNTYQWQVIIVCNPKDREADKLVEGWLLHTPLTSEQKAKIQKVKENSLEQARLYSEFGFWNETMKILDQLRERNPQAQAEWVELLTSVKLEKLSAIPGSKCCQVSSTSPAPQN